MQLRKRVGGDWDAAQRDWLALEQLAEVAVTSEDPNHPIEQAVSTSARGGWRAAGPGEQRLRIRFDEPQAITLVHLVFEEAVHERVQEFVLRWSGDGARTFQPVVRQQFSFSPSGATREAEDYQVNLSAVTHLELHIVPDVSHGSAVATLSELRLR